MSTKNYKFNRPSGPRRGMDVKPIAPRLIRRGMEMKKNAEQDMNRQSAAVTQMFNPHQQRLMDAKKKSEENIRNNINHAGTTVVNGVRKGKTFTDHTIRKAKSVGKHLVQNVGKSIVKSGGKAILKSLGKSIFK